MNSVECAKVGPTYVNVCRNIFKPLRLPPRYTSGRKASNEGKSGLRLLAVTLQQLRHRYQLLLLPVIGYIGAEQAFMAADFTQVTISLNLIKSLKYNRYVQKFRKLSGSGSTLLTGC